MKKFRLISGVCAIVVLVIIVSIFLPRNTYAKEEEYITVTNIYELNEALGGNHKISGNTLTLTSDVVLDYKSIDIDNYQDSKLVINLNGKTISKANESMYMFYLGNCDSSLSHTDLYIKGTGTIRAKNTIFQLLWQNGDLYYIKPIFKGNISYYSTDGSIVSTDACVSMVIQNGYFFSENNQVLYDVASDIEFSSDLKKETAIVKISGGVIDGSCRIETKQFEMTGGMINGEADISCYKSTFRGGIVNGKLVVSGVGPTALYIKDRAVFNQGVLLNTCELTTKVSGGTILAEDVGIVCQTYDPTYPISNKLYLTGGLISVTSSGSYGIYVNDPYQGWDEDVWRVYVKGGHIVSVGNDGRSAIRLNSQSKYSISNNISSKDVMSGFNKFTSTK